MEFPTGPNEYHRPDHGLESNSQPDGGEPAFHNAQPEDTGLYSDSSSALEQTPEGDTPDNDLPPDDAEPEQPQVIRLRGKRGGNNYEITVTQKPGAQPGKIYVQKGFEAVDEQDNPLKDLPKGVTRVSRSSMIVTRRGENGEAETDVYEMNPLRALMKRILGRRDS